MKSTKIINFEIGKTYTGFYEYSKKKCKIKIIRITAQETTIEVSTLNRPTKLPTSAIFSIGDDGVEILRFYNVWKRDDMKRDYIVAYADGRIEKGEIESVDDISRFIVGNVYRGFMTLRFESKMFPVKCIKRTKRFAEFEWTAKVGGVDRTLIGKMYIRAYGGSEWGVIKTDGYRDIDVLWDEVECANKTPRQPDGIHLRNI